MPAPEKAALRGMVEQYYRHNAGIPTPILLDTATPLKCSRTYVTVICLGPASQPATLHGKHDPARLLLAPPRSLDLGKRHRSDLHL